MFGCERQTGDLTLAALGQTNAELISNLAASDLIENDRVFWGIPSVCSDSSPTLALSLTQT